MSAYYEKQSCLGEELDNRPERKAEMDAEVIYVMTICVRAV